MSAGAGGVNESQDNVYGLPKPLKKDAYGGESAESYNMRRQTQNYTITSNALLLQEPNSTVAP
jgi:hypothetical protein